MDAIQRYEFARWLDQEVTNRGWSFRELGRRAGLSSGAVSAVMTGRSPAGWDLCRGVAEALGLPPEAVFRRAGLLPPLPPPVDEEREALLLLRQLPPAKRQDVLTMLRALANREPATAQPATSQPAASPPDEEALEQHLLDEFRQLPEAWQHEALREVERLQHYRTLDVHIIGAEEEELETVDQALEGEDADGSQAATASKAA